MLWLVAIHIHGLDAHADDNMVKLKRKDRKKGMEVEGAAAADDESAQPYVYAPPAAGGAIKKKKMVKLTRKQKLRKSKHQERGEALLDRQSRKQERDARRLEKRLAAKSLW